MRKFLKLILLMLLCSGLAYADKASVGAKSGRALGAKGQLNIIGKTYANPDVALDGAATTGPTKVVPRDGGYIFVDGKKRGMTSSEDALTVMLSEGEHTVEVIYPYTNYHILYGSKKVFVGEGTVSTIAVSATSLELTKEGRIQKAEEEARIAKERAEPYSQKFLDYMSKFYRDDTKDVVIDPTFKLMWQDSSSGFSGDFDSSKKYCEDLDYAGYSDWRLPTINELLSIVDDRALSSFEDGKYSINKAFRYLNTSETMYRSSTIDVVYSTYARNVDFVGGNSDRFRKSTERSVRCVRQFN